MSSGASVPYASTRHGATSVMRILLLTLCLSGLTVAHIEAQPGSVSVSGRRDLDFGTIFAGVPEHVLPTDSPRSGEFRVSGPEPNLFVLTFTLPADLVGPGGALLPMSYAVDDAGIALATLTLFDPNKPYSFTMTSGPVVVVFLGATASPSIGQQPGDYSATVTLTADCAAC